MKTLKLFFTPTINHHPLTILMFLLVLLVACSNSDNSNKNEYWTCTMHPQVHKDGPGACPICGMDLIKKVVDETDSVSTKSDMEGMLTLTADKQILANVSTIKVKKENLQKELTAYSYLDFVEQNRKTIPAKFNGRIEKLFVDKTGDYIQKSQPLFEIYSPDLVQAQNEYLIALSSNKNENNSLIEASKKKLELFGLTSDQIEELKNSSEIKLTLTYYSPVNGTVIEKKVQEGMYVSEGTTIYEVAELSTLWNIAEVNETDLSTVKVGSKVRLKLKAYPGEEFTGRVTFVYPVVNPQTRTIKVRSEFSSQNNKLKPQMYGETIFSADAGTGLLIPADAVIFSGNRNVVWIKTSDGMFEARNVQIGQKFGDKYQILSGLNEGEEVAASGGFLIDSESQLKTGMPTGHQHGNDSNSKDQKKSSSDNMEGMDMPK
ncbi:MAG TPA: efflux RND transporter periplasmic adaptor subunit [Ignavibacteriaceae bacterium]|nr:efflux RND transporter periplasmic adaptor subunit [Ignavibacteriaceae bacterium]